MAIGEYCEQQLNAADSCVRLPVKTIDQELDPVRYGSEGRDEPLRPGKRHHGVLIGDPPRCHDRGALPGPYHQVGCDWSECPRCHDQLIGCECDPEATSSSATEEELRPIKAGTGW